MVTFLNGELDHRYNSGVPGVDKEDSDTSLSFFSISAF